MKVERLKRILKIVALGVFIGLVSAALQMALHIDQDVFLHWYWIVAAAAVAGAVLINVAYNIFYQQKMKKLIPLLEAGRPQEYVAGVEKLLETVKGQSLRKILTMNLAAGYIDLKEFDRAAQLLEGISDKGLVGSAVKTVYRLNLCTCYFQSGRGEQALELYHDSQAIFEPQRKGKLYGGNLAILDMLAAIQSGEYSRAEQLLDQARRTWGDARLQEAFQEIGHTLTEIEKENTL